MSDSNPLTRLKRRALAPLMLACLLLAQAPAARPQGAAARPAAALTQAETAALARVRAETIREVTAALSAPEMQGRGTGQPGGERAAQYIAARYAKLGLKPLGGKDSFLQPIRFREFQVTPESYFKIDDEPLRMGVDFAATPPHSGDEELSGGLVFVGYGQPARDELRGLDLRGKVAVVIWGPPKGVSEAQWKKSNGVLAMLQGVLSARPAALVFTNQGKEQTPYHMFADYMTRRQVELEDAQRWPDPAPPFVSVSDSAAERLFAGSGTTYAEARAAADRGERASRELKATAKIRLKFRSAQVTGSNVVGLLEGSDPALRAEAVALTAHYDGWGAGADGRVFHGAADNALGVAEMIAVAEALAGGSRPRRSVIFLAVTGEEHGLYGSEHWVKNPTWKLTQIAADFNFDGMGTEIYGPVKQVVGFGAEHSDLGATLEAVAAATGSRVVPDPMPEEKSFYRSDHYAFVKRGVPALMLMGAPDITKDALVARVRDYNKKAYHLPADVITPDWNWEGPRGLAQLGLAVVMRVANADAMPAWRASSPFNRERGTDKPPPEEP